MTALDVYLEIGAKRAFAVAVDWPGWARSGPDEQAAVNALIAYGPRYRHALGAAAKGLAPPTSTAELHVVERLEGGAGTNFGVPGAIPPADQLATDDDELGRLTDLLRAAWAAFDKAADAADGTDLAPAGPRGGGRTLDKIRFHVAEAEAAYVQAVGGKHDAKADWASLREQFIVALGARARGELPDTGPRGGRRWPVRYAVRRSAWHALDHAWEIEDRRAS